MVADFEEFTAAGTRGLVLIGREIARLVLAPVVESATRERTFDVDDWAINRVKLGASALAAVTAMVSAELAPTTRKEVLEHTRMALPLFGVYARLVCFRVSGDAAVVGRAGSVASGLHQRILAEQGDAAAVQQQLDKVRDRLLSATGRLAPWVSDTHTVTELAALHHSGWDKLLDYGSLSTELLQQDIVRARYMTRFVLPLGEDHTGSDHSPEKWGVLLEAPVDANASLQLGSAPGLDEAIEAFAGRAGSVWPNLLATDRDEHVGARAEWLALTRALELVALHGDQPTQRAPARAEPGAQTATGLAGSRLGGYDIELEVGRGGMGVVYRAKDRPLARTVALKVLSPTVFAPRELRRRFEHELHGAVAIEHPFVVPIYAAGEDRGLFYIAMRFIDGIDLAKILTPRTPLPLPRALTLFAQLASALDATHRRGIVHRDVKPQNVLVAAADTPDEHALLSDFGIAQALDAATEPTPGQHVIGTPTYMAPEVASGEPSTPASDQYSLACLLYAMLTGHPPYTAPATPALIQAHLTAPVPNLATACPSAPPALVHATSRALAKDPAQRHPTVRAFAQAAEGVARWLDTPDAITRRIELATTETLPIA